MIKNITNDEKWACYYENFLRMENNLSLRQFYARDPDTKYPNGKLIDDRSNFLFKDEVNPILQKLLEWKK